MAVIVAACGVSVPHGQYGPYVSGQEKHLRLVSGESLVIYRVKYWTFSSGEDPAMQFEYEALDSLGDTVALRRRARELWPAFAPYVEALGTLASSSTAIPLASGVSRTMGVISRLLSRAGATDHRTYRSADAIPNDASKGVSVNAPSNKRLKLTARVDYGMNLSSARRSLGAIR